MQLNHNFPKRFMNLYSSIKNIAITGNFVCLWIYYDFAFTHTMTKISQDKYLKSLAKLVVLTIKYRLQINPSKLLEMGSSVTEYSVALVLEDWS